MKAIIEVKEFGTIEVELNPSVAPITVENFLTLVDRGYYDGVCFHRVIKDFMIQTGGYTYTNGKIVEKEKVNNIFGEFTANGFTNNLKHDLGVVSMARANAYDSASNQFFICTSNANHLDGNYAAFGRVSDDESLINAVNISNMKTVNKGSIFTDFLDEDIYIATIRRK